MKSQIQRLYSRVVARVVDAIIARAQRTPYEHLEGYMERYWLFQAPKRMPWLPSIRLHKFLRSDADRDLHTHPWWNVSLILRGVYWEIMPCSDKSDPGYMVGGYANLDEPFKAAQRKPGAIVFRRRQSRHKLMLFRGPVWTIFIHGRDRDLGWGYFVPGVGLVDRHDYQPRGERQ